MNLQIEKGSFVAVLGHNGSGKSTLAKLSNGILFPQSGQVIVDTDETNLDTHYARNRLRLDIMPTERQNLCKKGGCPAWMTHLTKI